MQQNGSIGTVPDYRVNMIEELTGHFMLEAAGCIAGENRRFGMIELLFFDGRLFCRARYSGELSGTIEGHLRGAVERYEEAIKMSYGFFSSN